MSGRGQHWVLSLLCGWVAVSGVRAETIGFVLQSYDYLYFKTPEARECPDGLARTNEEQWEVQFPTVAARKAHLARCLLPANRGPHCENVWSNPDVIRDPVPFRAVEGQTAYGANLDGTEDGRATTSTCAHRKFTSPNGEWGIDNQYYRFLGCEKFIRSPVYSTMSARDRTAQYLINRLLLELRGAGNQENAASVDVVLYRGKDSLLLDANGDALPWQSQRIDASLPPIRLKGRIEKGLLLTEPADVFFEGLFHERRQLIRGMQLRLKLDGVHATGMRVGYVDVDRFWESYAHTAQWGGNTFGASPPSAHAALRELADGYKDQKTGSCTALSSAREYKFVRAHLIHNSGDPH